MKTTFTAEVVSAFGQHFVVITSHGQIGNSVAYAGTREEAEQAKRAFEQVLLPRFTRDEAIAIVKEARERHNIEDSFALPEERAERDTGIRLALEALAAAGVFVDAPGTPGQPKDVGRMADLLDAAGIR